MGYYNRVQSSAANIVLGGSALFCVLSFFYFLYHYAWTHERSFDSFLGPVLHYVVPASLAVLLIASLRSSPRFKIKLTLAWLVLWGTIYAIEIALAFRGTIAVLSGPTVWIQSTPRLDELVAAAAEDGSWFDSRSNAEIIAHLRATGVSAVPAIHPLALSRQRADGTYESVISVNGRNILPTAGIGNRVTLLCNEGRPAIYESDRYGFHNPNAVWDAAPAEVVAVGDSQTHGACVPSDKNFVSLIRSGYPATVNLGVIGQGPLSTLATLKEYAPYVRPKKVLWFFFAGNDFSDLRRERNFPLLMRYLDRDFSQGLLQLAPDIDRVLEKYTDPNRREIDFKALPQALKPILKLTHTRERVYRIGNRMERPSLETTVNEDEIELLGKILSEAKATVEGWKGVLYFVYLPRRERYLDGHADRFDEETRQRTLGVTRSTGVTVIDIHEGFDSQRDPLEFFSIPRFLHYSEAGHAVIAQNVLRALSSLPGEKP